MVSELLDLPIPLEETTDDARRFPVVEVFGPTIQGEGVDQGIPCHFVRFGGCDYRCDWCDSPHAVLPHLVRQAVRMTAQEIIDKLQMLPKSARWVVLSGGNPCLHDLGNLVTMLHLYKYQVALETQGTRWKQWIQRCERICVSPKPPSSGHSTDFIQLKAFLNTLPVVGTFLKVVVSDQRDYKFSKRVRQYFPYHQMCLSACNDAGVTVGNPTRKDTRSSEQVALDLIARGRWLANMVMIDPEMSDVRVQCQFHTLMWGNERGR